VAASADPATRTYAVKVSLDAKAPPPLGATVTVIPQLHPGGVPAMIKIPISALRQEGAGTAVWVLERSTMTVRSQTVQVATADGNDAVIASGLQPGMVIVSAGVHVLAPGQKVSVWQEKTSGVPPLATQVPAQPVAGATQAATLATTR